MGQVVVLERAKGVKRKEKKKEEKRSEEKRNFREREKQQEIKGSTNKMKSKFCTMRATDKVDEASAVNRSTTDTKREKEENKRRCRRRREVQNPH